MADISMTRFTPEEQDPVLLPEGRMGASLHYKVQALHNINSFCEHPPVSASRCVLPFLFSDYSGPRNHPGRRSAQPDRVSVHFMQSSLQFI